MGVRREVHRTDGPHAEIMGSLRSAGFGCVSTANCGGFLGDIVVAADGMSLILEVKPHGWKGPRNKREQDQQNRRVEWRQLGGQVEVVRSSFEALQYVRFGLGTALE